jgi:Cu/Ag efflux protein CusF
MHRHQVHLFRPTGVLAQASIVALSTLLLTSINAAAQMKMDNQPAGQAQQATTASAAGTVTAVNQVQHKVTLDHAAIPAIN